MMINMLWRAAISVLMLSTPPALAREDYSATDAELASLPSFCTVRMKQQGSPKYKALESQYGRENWVHFYHYCDAVRFVNRSMRATNSRDRESTLRVAVGNYNYLIANTAKNFFMRPQIYVELGRVHMKLKEPSEAMRLFYSAIAFEPRYTAAYVALLQVLGQSGSRSAALEAATNGLRYIPDSKFLKDAYLEFGGREPFPEPLATAAPGGATASDGSSDDGAAARGADAESTAEDSAATSELDDVPESGCRFCPPEVIQERWRESFQQIE